MSFILAWDNVGKLDAHKTSPIEHINMSNCTTRHVDGNWFATFTRVTVLDLSSNLFSSVDSLHTHQQDLTALVRLNLYNVLDPKSPTLQLPSFNAKAPNVVEFKIAQNKLPSFPKGISNMGSLVTLIADGNNITSIPDELYQLNNLKTLNIARNKIQSISSEIKQLCKLEQLLAANNELEQLPRELFELPKLIKLELTGNGVFQFPDTVQVINKDPGEWDFDDTEDKCEDSKLVVYNFYEMPCEIVPGLYLGSMDASTNKFVLRSLNIKGILNVSECECLFPQVSWYHS